MARVNQDNFLNIGIDLSGFSMKSAALFMHTRYEMWNNGDIGNLELGLAVLTWKITAVAFTCFNAIGAVLCGPPAILFSACDAESEAAQWLMNQTKECLQGLQESLVQLFFRMIPTEEDVSPPPQPDNLREALKDIPEEMSDDELP
jgi:hypothetical protein